jgi:hypothetical protein
MKIKVLVPLRDEAGRGLNEEQEVCISFFKYLQIRLGLGAFWKYGRLSPLWHNDSELWIICCKRHGFVATYRAGYDGRLECLFCLREAEALYRKG